MVYGNLSPNASMWSQIQVKLPLIGHCGTKLDLSYHPRPKCNRDGGRIGIGWLSISDKGCTVQGKTSLLGDKCCKQLRPASPPAIDLNCNLISTLCELDSCGIFKRFDPFTIFFAMFTSDTVLVTPQDFMWLSQYCINAQPSKDTTLAPRVIPSPTTTCRCFVMASGF